MKQTIIFILSFLWGLPQNIAAIICLFCLGCDFPYAFRDGAFLVQMSYGGGLTLGNFIFLGERAMSQEQTIRHELGHVKQSYILGVLYLFVIGIPSLVWAANHRKWCQEKSYYWFYTERWANSLAGIE